MATFDAFVESTGAELDFIGNDGRPFEKQEFAVGFTFMETAAASSPPTPSGPPTLSALEPRANDGGIPYRIRP